MQANNDHIRIAKIVGENDEGLTLFVPKDMEGVFELTEGDKFLTMMFLKGEADGSLTPWLPWESDTT